MISMKRSRSLDGDIGRSDKISNVSNTPPPAATQSILASTPIIIPEVVTSGLEIFSSVGQVQSASKKKRRNQRRSRQNQAQHINKTQSPPFNFANPLLSSFNCPQQGFGNLQYISFETEPKKTKAENAKIIKMVEELTFQKDPVSKPQPSHNNSEWKQIWNGNLQIWDDKNEQTGDKVKMPDISESNIQKIQKDFPKEILSNEPFSFLATFKDSNPIESEPQVKLIPTLKLLTTLDAELGLLAPKILDLLSEAFLSERRKCNSSDELLLNEKNLNLVELSKAKLEGLQEESFVPWTKIKTVEKAINCITKLLEQQEKANAG